MHQGSKLRHIFQIRSEFFSIRKPFEIGTRSPPTLSLHLNYESTKLLQEKGKPPCIYRQSPFYHPLCQFTDPLSVYFSPTTPPSDIVEQIQS
ncbi:hypothetical protein CDAR_26421 [Caerostris darwini]|uniref:Uncharacterized protein n=1 Tax=Caerostris darwini TaxID=1538125 RepID=A0AAV4QD79_9ARAC|nr:hypothetical protein CDAR_26421 [Caerostris darwini]